MLYLPLVAKDISNIARILPLDFCVPPHWHDEIEILYVMAGSFTVKINGEQHTLSPGQSIWVSSMEVHEYIVPPGEKNTTVLHLTVSPLLIGEGFQELVKCSFRFSTLDFNNPIGPPPPVMQQISQYFAVIMEELQQPAGISMDGDWSIRGSMLGLAVLMRRYLLQAETNNSPRHSHARYATTTIYDAIEYVQQHYAQNIPVDTVAALTGYKRSNFCKHFKKATNMSFHQYLNNYRVSRACALLGEHSSTITSVAERVGFPEAKTFCRVFKACTGLTPGEYRSTLFAQERSTGRIV